MTGGLHDIDPPYLQVGLLDPPRQRVGSPCRKPYLGLIKSLLISFVGPGVLICCPLSRAEVRLRSGTPGSWSFASAADSVAGAAGMNLV